MKSDNLQIGFDGEAAAKRYVESLGYRVIEQNYRSGRWGELDIVCIDDEDLVFVEVKTRSGQQYGQPIEAMTYGKLQRIMRTAQHFKLTHPDTPDSMRFDVVTVDVDSRGASKIELYRNVTG